MVGIDYLSVAGYESDTSMIHAIWLKGGIWIIEGWNLSGVQPGSYDVLCLPLTSLVATEHRLVRWRSRLAPNMLVQDRGGCRHDSDSGDFRGFG